MNNIKIENKKLNDILSSLPGVQTGKKYFKKSDLNKIQYDKQTEEKHKQNNEINKSTSGLIRPSSNQVRIIQRKKTQDVSKANTKELPKLEILRRFRLMGEPIRLFGENEEQRKERLRKAELIKGDSLFIDNDGPNGGGHYAIDTLMQKNRELLFAKDSKLEDIVEEEEFIERLYQPILSDSEESPFISKDIKTENLNSENDKQNEKSTKTQLDIECDIIGDYFATALNEWKDSINALSPEEKMEHKNKNDILIFRECQENLILFFKICKHRGLPSDIRASLMEIVKFCKEKNYKNAYASYLHITIGSGTWSMGVNGIGIHERVARDQIQSKHIQHVLNDDNNRKIFMSIKSVMNHIQSTNPTLPSLRM